MISSMFRLPCNWHLISIELGLERAHGGGESCDTHGVDVLLLLLLSLTNKVRDLEADDGSSSKCYGRGLLYS